MRLFFGLILAFIACASARGEGQEMADHKSALRVGTASATVNPPIGSFIAGDAQNRRFTRVQDDLFAKAVVFDDGDTPVALVVVDCIGLPFNVIQAIREAAAERVTTLDLPAQRIVVSSTHTHSGPDVVGIWGPDYEHSGLDPDYIATLVETAALQVAKAAEALQPATLQFNTVTYEGDWVRNICEPGVLDRDLTVLQALSTDGTSIVTLTNFACHPTIFDAVHTFVSADWIGGFYRTMAAKLPGEHIFIQGAVGGWVQPEKKDQDIPLADEYGGDVAATALTALESAKAITDTAIEFASMELTLPVENEGWKALSRAGIVDRSFDDTLNTELVWFAVGPAQFVTHPGETPPAYSTATKAMMNSEPKFIIGLGMDALGYILKPEYFDPKANMRHAEYLTSMSLGSETGPRIMQALGELIPHP